MARTNEQLELKECPVCRGTRWWGDENSFSSKQHLGFRCEHCSPSNKALTVTEPIWSHKIARLQDKGLLNKIKTDAPDNCKDCSYRGVRTNFCYRDFKLYNGEVSFCLLESDGCPETTQSNGENIELKSNRKVTKQVTKTSDLNDSDIFPGWQVRIYSTILKETFTLYENGTLIFDSGVEYNESEWRMLIGLSHNELRAVHNTKSVFPKSKVTEIKENPKKKCSTTN